jgi:signal transduction histidine kinase
VRAWLRPRLRTILLLINLIVLALPLAGIAVLRIYESALIRQTESELIAQGAFISSTYQALFARLAIRRDARGRVLETAPNDYGLALEYHAPARKTPGLEDPWRPRAPELDLASDRIRPAPPEPAADTTQADALAQAIGRELNPILRGAQLYTLAGIRVVDIRGVIVASTFQDELGKSMLDFEEIVRALRGEPVSLLRARSASAPPPLETISRGAHVRVFVTVPIMRDGRVIAAALLVRTPANIKQALYGKRNSLVAGAVLLLLVVLALSLLTSFTIARPLRALIAQAQRAARGERGAVTPLRAPGTQEVAELSETVAAMAATLESRATYIRDFAAHVSHEFKTPLTAIQGAVELLRDHNDAMSAEERGRFLDILAQDASRLERLVRRLLELARADMLQATGGRTPLGPAIAALAERYRGLGVHVELTDTADADVAISPETLDAVLGNLLENARQHGGGTVTVSIASTVDRLHRRAVIEIADDGAGISAANAARIFEPFFTTARDRGNTGLGLAIIRSLLTAHGGDIALLTAAGTGAAFQIRLPLAQDAAPKMV